MKAGIAEWAWRILVLVALCWIGMELRRLHDDVSQPAEEQQTAAATPDDAQDSLDQLQDAVDSLNDKVDAILVVLAHSPSLSR